MENVGENFANSCRREDKMRREGGIVLKKKKRRRRKNTNQEIPIILRIYLRKENLLDLFCCKRRDARWAEMGSTVLWVG